MYSLVMIRKELSETPVLLGDGIPGDRMRQLQLT
jgi:hypothetical protein